MHRDYGECTASRGRTNVAVLTAIWVGTAVLILPAVFHWPASVPHYGLDRYFRYCGRVWDRRRNRIPDLPGRISHPWQKQSIRPDIPDFLADQRCRAFSFAFR